MWRLNLRMQSKQKNNFTPQIIFGHPGRQLDAAQSVRRYFKLANGG